MLAATPVHFQKIERAAGVRVTVARLSSTSTTRLALVVDRVRAPYWLDLGLRTETGFTPLEGRKLTI